MASPYYTPSSQVTTTTFEKKSRFVTRLLEVSSKEEASEHLQAIAAEESGANHNCFAYIIGNPASSTDMQCSDDGEPSGTAGKPLLNILLHENIGNVLVVVTRYFGGIKLGTGGLVRAYSAALKSALEAAELIEYVSKSKMTIRFDYPFEGAVRRRLDDIQASVIEAQYGEDVLYDILVLENFVDPLLLDLREITAGRVEVKMAGGKDKK